MILLIPQTSAIGGIYLIILKPINNTLRQHKVNRSVAEVWKCYLNCRKIWWSFCFEFSNNTQKSVSFDFQTALEVGENNTNDNTLFNEGDINYRPP